jgi:glycosyltransferase involved in cell wall biosynthesis
VKSEPLAVSALIISAGRPQWLKRCVQSLVQQSGPETPLRIEIAINGPDAESEQAARWLTQNFPQQSIRVERLQARLTPAEARNRMLPNLAGEWVLFIDDDAYIEPDYFETFRRTLARFPEAVAIGGPNLTPPGSTVFQEAAGEALCSRLATFTSVSRYRPTGDARTGSDTELILCNLFVRLDLLRELADTEDGVFPPDFKCAEENWLLQSLAAEGLKIVYEPRLCVRHERRGRPREFATQVYKYGYGRGQNIRRRPETLRAVHLLPSFCLALTILTLMKWLLLGGFEPAFRVLTAAYVMLCVVAAARVTRDFRRFWIILFLFPLIHASYGAGVLRGFGSTGPART